MKHIKLFENFSINEEFETLEIKSVAKKIYSDLKSQGKKVTLNYQDEKLGAAGKSKKIGEKEISSQIICVDYFVNHLIVSPIVEESEAKQLLEKYKSNKISGDINFHKMDYEWAKNIPGWWVVTFRLVEQKQRQDYNLTKGFVNRQNKNDRKRQINVH